MSRRSLTRTSLLIAVICSAYLSGYLTHATVVAETTAPAPFPQLATFARVLSHIERSYVDPVDDEEMLYGAIKSMVSSLDPHSNFLTPAEFTAMREDTRGEYVGVGMELGTRDGHITVITPFEGGPAFDAGLLTGDRLIEVDGERVTERSIEEIVLTLRGEQGVPVHLRIHRPLGEGDEYEMRTFELIRDVIRIPAVENRLVRQGVGYISVRSFQAGVTNDVRTALDDLLIANDGELAGLVLDFRNNPGGLLSEAVSMSDLFLDDGRVVSTEGRHPGENDVFDSRDGNTMYMGPMVVLINGGTASASEIVAGAIRDRDRGAIMGTTSFGKGTVQSIIDFDDGSGLKLTTSRYYTPDHISIHGDGIEPDVEVLAGTLEPADEVEGFESITDPQLHAAVTQLLDGQN